MSTIRRRSQYRLGERCGICDEPLAAGQPTVTIDDERCHAECDEHPNGDPLPHDARCEHCGERQDDESLADGVCWVCGEGLP